MILIKPTNEYCSQIQAYRKEFLDCGDSMDGTGGLRRIENPEEWVERCRLTENADTVPDGLVPATQYIFVREEDNKIVGMIQIRHFLNEHLKKYGGHIGYSVTPSERLKGYASNMLKMALLKCKELGIDKVLITCDKPNEASRRTIVKNGGILENEVEDDTEPGQCGIVQRYWINL